MKRFYSNMNTQKNIWFVLLITVICFALVGCSAWKKAKIGWMKYTADVNPSVREFDISKRHQWKPEGKRQIQATHALMPRQNIWRLRHGDSMNSDEVTTVTAPVLGLDWVSETAYFNPSPQMLDSKGDVYSAPKFPTDQALLIKLDGRTGKLKWKITGYDKVGAGAGLPLVMSDPENPGQEIIYAGRKAEVIAVHPNGEIIYHKRTGFSAPPETFTHENLAEFSCFGPSYNPVMDGLVWVTGSGLVYALDRKTGEQNIEPFQLPGKKSPAKEKRKLPKALKKLEQEELSYMFEGAPKGYSLELQVYIVLGEEVNVSNFYSIDQRTGAIWIAATDLDEKDGKKDGVSEYGAMYRIDIVPDDNGKYKWKMVIGAKLSFDGGSASTPAFRGDGKRGYVGDAFGNLIAFDYDGNVLWKYTLGGEKGANQIAGSVSVSSDNNELYCITRRDIIKIVDKGDHGELAWRAKLDMYEDINSNFHQWNTLTAAITANGIAFIGGVGPAFKLFGDTPTFCPVKVGAGLLDRQTGELRWFADGKDDGQSSIAMTVPTPDGGVIVPHSPFRRAIARGVFGDRIHPTRGGMTKYGPRRIDLMLRDISVAAADRINRGVDIYDIQPLGTKADLAAVADLISQARMVAPRGIKAGDISTSSWNIINRDLEMVEKLHKDWQNNQDMNLLKQSADVLEKMATRLEAEL